MKEDIFKLKNGLTILVVQTNSFSINLNLVVKCGAFFPKDQKIGLAHMVEHNIFTNENDDVTRSLQLCGTYMDAFTDDFYTTYNVRTFKEYLNIGIKALTEKVFNAKFNKNFFNKEKKVILQEYYKVRDNIVSDTAFKALDVFYENTFISKSGYGIGTKEQIDEISFDDLVDFYNRFYRTDNSLFVITGDVDIKDIKKIFNEYIDENNEECVKEHLLLDIGVENNKEIIIKQQKINDENAYVHFLFSGVNEISDSKMAFELFTYILSNISNFSLIKKRLRDDLSYIYDCDCTTDMSLIYKHCGTISLMFSTNKNNVENAIIETLKCVKNISANEISELLEIAKKHYINNLKIKMENLDFVANQNIKTYIYNQESFNFKKVIKQVENITVYDILNVKDFILNHKIVIFIQGNLKNMPQLMKFINLF